MRPARWADADADIVCGTLLLCHLIGVLMGEERGCQHVDSNGRWCTVRNDAGALPSNHGASEFSSEHDCLYNIPGNEGQEQSISGAGCRTLIQSVMFGALTHCPRPGWSNPFQ